MNKISGLSAAFTLVALLGTATAQTAATPSPSPAPAPAPASPAPAPPGPGDLLSYFSAGLAVMRLSTPEVETAEVRSGKIRITEQTETRISPWLQAHYIFDAVPTDYLKPGVFVGVGLGSNGSSFDTFGAGVMLSMKRAPWSNKADKNALNIGIGWYTTKYRVLANDTPDGGTLPTGVESVQYLRQNQSGVMLNISFSI